MTSESWENWKITLSSSKDFLGSEQELIPSEVLDLTEKLSKFITERSVIFFTLTIRSILTETSILAKQ